MWPFKREQRASIEDPRVPLGSIEAWRSLFQEWKAVSGVVVTTETAFSVPAFSCGVRFIGATMAALPLHLYSKDADGRRPAEADPLYSILHDVVNDDGLTSFKWRATAMTACLTGGRAFTFIERNRAGRVMNLWPLDPRYVVVVRRGGRTFYEYQEPGAARVTYAASEVIDIPFMLYPDGMTHVSPVERMKNCIGLSIAMEEYASLFFQNGGVPPLAMTGPVGSPGALARAKADVWDAIKRSNKDNVNVLYLPTGHDLKAVGFNPEQGQLTEARLFQLQEIARVLGLPPVFLHDLSRGTFSNTEQQDLAFVKHTMTQWCELWEQELNAKLFSARNRRNFVEFNVDGLLRGDFASRMAGYAQAIQNGIRTPDEVRDKENLQRRGGAADRLYVQGATVPLDQAGNAATQDAMP